MSAGLIDGDPRRLGGYWLAGRLGASGRGVVYEAYDADGGRVAVKVLHGDADADPELRDRFRREAAAVRRVAPFCTAAVLDAGLDGPKPYIVSEYVAGPSLCGAVVDGRRFTGGDLHHLATAVATALTAIHHAGAVHHDLRPGTVLLGPDGLRVIGFGVARAPGTPSAATGSVRAAPGDSAPEIAYTAPEIFTGGCAGTAADVFAWGGVVLFATTGTDPFRAEGPGGVPSVQPQLDMLPERLRPLVAASLATDPRARPAAGDLLLALAGENDGLDIPRLLAAGGAAGARIRSVSQDPALGTLAERAHATLGLAEREFLPEILLRLVTVTDDGELTVRRARWAELLDGRPEAEAAAVRRVLQVFAHLVDHDDHEVWLSRPALPQAWPRLRVWVRANLDGLAAHRGIRAAARHWWTRGRRDGDLFRGGTLESAVRWAAVGRRDLTLDRAERDFLEASATLARRRARRGRALSVTLAGLLVVVFAAGAPAVQQGRRAGAGGAAVALQRDRAEARRLAVTADELRVADPVRAMLLSVAAWRLAPVTEARASLTGSLAQRETSTFHDPVTAPRTFRALSRDGRTLVSAGRDEARIWDVRTGRRIGGFRGIGDDPRWVALSPGGRLLAVIAGRELKVWDVAKGRPTGAALAVREGGGETRALFGQAEDRLLVTEGRRLMVWNLTTGDRRFPPVAGMNSSASAAVSPATASATSSTSFVPVPAPAPTASSVAFDGTSAATFDVTADGRRLVVGDPGGGAAAWTLEGLRGTRLGDRCAGCATRVAYSPDGAIAAVGGEDTVRLYDAVTGADLGRVLSRGNGGVLRFSQDGRFLAAAARTSVRLWRVEDGELLLTQRIDAFEPAVAFDPDGRTLRYLTEGSVTALDIADLTRPDVLRGAGAAWAELSPGGRLLAVRGERSDRIRIWDVRRREPVATLTLGAGVGDSSFGMAFSGDGRRLAAVGGDPAAGLEIWDTSTSERIAVIRPAGEGRMSAVALNADGTAVASQVVYADPAEGLGGRAGEVYAWDLPGGRRNWSHAGGRPGALRFAPGGRALALVGGEQRLLDAATGRPFGLPYGPPAVDGPVTALEFGGNGAGFAVADRAGRISVWETATGKRVGTPIRGGAGAGARLAYSPRGDVIAAAAGRGDGSGDDGGGGRGDGSGAVALWDITTGRRLGRPIPVGTGTLRSLAFTADGSRLVTVDSAGTLAEHPVDPELVARAVCERAGRTLSPAEWTTFMGEIPYRKICPG